MKPPYLFKRNGKNVKVFYYLRCTTYYLTPRWLLRRRLKRVLAQADARPDAAQIRERVDYYNKLDTPTRLPGDAVTVGGHRLKGNKSVYFFDTFEFTRWFDPRLRWCHVFGDVIHIPPVPSVVKSRPLAGDNRNSVLINMDKVRHFCFMDDSKPFAEKRDTLIFRGDAAGKPNRLRFIEMYRNHPMCDVADVSTPEGATRMMTLYEHLDYKFIMALEGNDVASNLKWVMSSNSIAVMPRPTCETWFMEGRLIPDYHYIEIKSDFSDLEERLNHYIQHPEQAQRIIDNAHQWVGQFRDKKRERIISLMVFEKYFRFTNDIGQ